MSILEFAGFVSRCGPSRSVTVPVTPPTRWAAVGRGGLHLRIMVDGKVWDLVTVLGDLNDTQLL